MSGTPSGRQLHQSPLPGMGDVRSGYRGPAVCRTVGITYRQLDYWTTTGLVRASVRDAEGSGTQRLYGFDDIVQLKLIKRLLDAGVDLRRIRKAVAFIREQGLSVGDVTLVSDGATVYAIDDERQLIDLLQRGQGVFAIAVPPLVAETEAEIVRLPSERVEPAPSADTAAEEHAELPG